MIIMQAEEELDINTTYVQMRYPVFSNPNILAFMLSDFLKKTLDIAGLRLSWPTTPTGIYLFLYFLYELQGCN